MLNNIEDLIISYKKYERLKKIKRISLILLAFIGLFISFKVFQEPDLDHKREFLEKNTSKKIIEINQTKIIEENEQNLTQEKNETNSLDDSSAIGKFGLKVTTQTSSRQQLLENHRRRHSYSSTIALANYFYSKKSYKDAISWAISASKINRLKDEPWLIYAKSKNALGQRYKAKQALRTFLKSNDSKKIRELLESL